MSLTRSKLRDIDTSTMSESERDVWSRLCGHHERLMAVNRRIDEEGFTEAVFGELDAIDASEPDVWTDLAEFVSDTPLSQSLKNKANEVRVRYGLNPL